MSLEFDLIVFSHLRWNFVWQRPQHLLSRFSQQRRVYFIEEPTRGEGPTRWEVSEPSPNVFICHPVTPADGHGFHLEQMETLDELIRQLLVEHKISCYAVWFYTPMAFPLLANLRPQAIIYDCMDELSAFLHAPPELLQHEADLLKRADVVFTGGPSLFRAKQHRHPHVYCFPSSIETAHFGRAKALLPEPPEQASIPHPRFGFFGVIDERFDVELLNATATARPDWQFVMVGPVVKIDPARLPQLPNVHYLGMKKYAELPPLLSGWDVCLLPFARNEATRFISPTKTLEYMAAEKPIVSTSITDVAEPYGDIVYLADTPEQFLHVCDVALNSTQTERTARTAKIRDVLSETSWDKTVEEMTALIHDVILNHEPVALRLNLGGGTGTQTPLNSTSASRSNSAVSSHSTATLTGKRSDEPSEQSISSDSETLQSPVVVIGAGPTGLSAAYHLGTDAILVEQNDRVGGWCRSIEQDGFTFDFAGHIMFSNDPYVHDMYQTLLGENVHWQNREAWIFSKNVYTRYPFQGALYGLPPEVIKECIMGAIESRFGTAKAPERNGSTPKATELKGLVCSHKQDGKVNGKSKGRVEDCCGDGVLESTAKLGNPRHAGESDGHAESRNGSSLGSSEPANFEEFIYKVWGRGIAKHFAIPYNRKLWAVPLTEMETSWLGGRVPLPDLEEMIDGALSPVGRPMGPNARFGYPLKGGFQAMMDGFLPLLKGPLKLRTRVVGFSPKRHQVTLSDGSVVNYEHLVSTMPLPVLIRLAGDEAPQEVQEAAFALRYISVRCVHLGIGRENLTEKHWIYYPEDTIFHRIFVQGNASPGCNPPGGFGLTCEITYHSHYKPLPYEGDDLISQCIDDCRKVGIIRPDDPVWTKTQVDMPHAYVIYDHARARNVSLIRRWLSQHDVILAGRYSEWEYYNSDHAFLAGKKAAEAVGSAAVNPSTAVSYPETRGSVAK
ncbi:MAG: UDP-galactopyranose mutase [Planctomycetaceae bacterium]|nr:UDP-galactopyranose mutase [Planctomycetaceae bacterium]